MGEKKKKKSKYQNQIFISMLLVTIIPVFILCIYSYNMYVTGISEKADVSVEATANQVKNRVDEVLNSVRKYYLEVDSRSEIEWLISGSNIDYSQYSKLYAADKILNGGYLRDYIGGYSFVNPKKGWVFTNNGMYPYEDVANLAEVQALSEELSIRYDSFWRNMISNKKEDLPHSNYVNLSGYMLVTKLPFFKDDENCMLVVNLDQNYLRDLITQNLAQYDITVLNTDGQLIHTTNKQMADFCKRSVSSELKGKKTITLPDGSKHRLTVATSEINDMIYVASYDKGKMNEGSEKILTFSGVLLLVILLVLFLSRLGTRWMYRPIRHLTEQVADFWSAANNDTDEFHYIEDGMHELVNNNQLLELVVNRQKSMLIELFILRLIRGESSKEKIEKNLEYFELEPRNCYVVMAAYCVFEEKDIMDDTKKDVIHIAIIENMPEEIIKQCFIRPVSHCNSMLFIIGGDTDEEFEDKIMHLYQDVSKYIRDTYGCFVNTGVSQVFHKLSHFRTVYNESLEALKINSSYVVEMESSHADSSLAFYSDFAVNEVIRHGYDLSLEQEVKHAVDKCDLDGALLIVDKFIDGLIHKRISSHQRSFYQHRFLIAIMLVATDAGLWLNSIFETETVNVFQSFDQLYDVDQISQFYKERVIEPVVVALTEFRRTHSSDIIVQVLELVKSKNGDLTLTECAETLNYHPSYIWKVLKTERNMTFTDFIAMEKLTIAKDMLLNTNLSVADIAKALKYSNTQNFIRFFGKYEKITPGKFRQNH